MNTARLHTREDSGIRLDREGRWFHDEILVEHPGIARAWSRGIEREPGGRYLLRLGPDWCVIAVEDAPLQVLGARVEDSQAVVMLSDGVEEPLRPQTLYARDEVLYCRAARGLEARFSRAAQAALGGSLEEHGTGLALRLGDSVFPIRALPEPSGAAEEAVARR